MPTFRNVAAPYALNLHNQSERGRQREREREGGRYGQEERVKSTEV